MFPGTFSQTVHYPAVSCLIAVRNAPQGRACLERLEGLNLLITPEIFNPALFGSSPFLARYLAHLPLSLK